MKGIVHHMSFIALNFSIQHVMNAVDSNLSATAGEQYRAMRAQLWAAMEDEISMADCDIYRFVSCIVILSQRILFLEFSCSID